MNVDNLIRLAFIYAEQDRGSFLDAIAHTDMEKEKRETRALVKRLRAYRIKRWGETSHEVTLRTAETKGLEEMRKLVKPGENGGDS